MNIKDEIFSSPNDIPGLLDKKIKPAAACVDDLFINFMYYAKKKWSYIASAKAGGEALLDGTATQVPCGGIATALKILIEEKLNQKVDYITKSGYVWTKPRFLCFDPKVKGNVSRAESPMVYNEGCLFKEHYFIKCGTKFYDPCLNSIYTMENDAVLKQYNAAEIISGGSIIAGLDINSVLVFRDNVTVTGWQRGAWLIVKERDILNVIKDKNDLLYISKNLKTGELALAARKASREMFIKVGRLPFWELEHRNVGIQV
jgi:hypothetical protein